MHVASISVAESRVAVPSGDDGTTGNPTVANGKTADSPPDDEQAMPAHDPDLRKRIYLVGKAQCRCREEMVTVSEDEATVERKLLPDEKRYPDQGRPTTISPSSDGGGLLAKTMPASDMKGGVTMDVLAPFDSDTLIDSADICLLTDYFLLLYSQVQRAVVRESESGSPSSKYGADRPGMRCRHCGGKKTGTYFPSCAQRLQSCTATLHKHMAKCEKCPIAVQRALERTKRTHEFQVKDKQRGSQITFFNRLWGRLDGESLETGRSCPRALADRLKAIVEQGKAPGARTSVGDGGTATDADFEIALDLLRRPPTPETVARSLEGAPAVDVVPTPVTRPTVPSPIATNVSLDEECHHYGGSRVLPSHDQRTDFENRTTFTGKFLREADGAPAVDVVPSPVTRPTVPPPIATKVSSDEDCYQCGGSLSLPGHDQRTDFKKRTSLTRKFSREVEMLLIRGMLEHGKKGCWKKICVCRS